MKRLESTEPVRRPVAPERLGELLAADAHPEARAWLTPAAVARWMAGFDHGYLREIGRFPTRDWPSDCFGVVVVAGRGAGPAEACLEIVRGVPVKACNKGGGMDTLTFISKAQLGPDGGGLKFLRSFSDLTDGIGMPFAEELAIARMGEGGAQLAEAAVLVSQRLYLGELADGPALDFEQKKLARYLPLFVRALAEVLLEAGLALPRALLPVLEYITRTVRGADGLFFPEEVLAWCAGQPAHAALGLTRDEVVAVLRDGGAQQAPDPAVLAALRWLDARRPGLRRACPSAAAISKAWCKAGCTPPLGPDRIDFMLQHGGCLRRRQKDSNAAVLAIARFVTEGPPLDPGAGRLGAGEVAEWWNHGHNPPIERSEIAAVFANGEHLTKLDCPVLAVWAWLRSGGSVAAMLERGPAADCATRILAWWREVQQACSHFTVWSAQPEAAALVAGVIEWLRPAQREFIDGRLAFHLDARWSVLRQPLDEFVRRRFAFPPELWHRVLVSAWRRAGGASPAADADP